MAEDSSTDRSAAPGRAHRAPTRKLIGSFVGLDVLFKVLVSFPSLSVMRISPAQQPIALRLLALLDLPMTAAWMIATVWILRPVERWLRDRRRGPATDDAIRRAGEAAYRAPHRFAVVWAAHWVSLFVAAAIVAVGPLRGRISVDAHAPESFALVLITCLLGALAVSFTFSAWFLRSIAADISLDARARGVSLGTRGLSVRLRLGLVVLCVSLAPACWVSALAYSAHLQAGPRPGADTFTLTLALVSAGVAVFAPLCAWMLATTLAEPVVRMQSVVAEITRLGDVASAGRIPIQQKDEIGTLAESVNRMIERLEAVSRERETMAQSLTLLNQNLEQRVAERTAALVTSNGQLKESLQKLGDTQRQLMEASRKSGRADVATAVLHNVGNVLNSVNVSANMLIDGARQSKATGLVKATQLLREHAGDLEKFLTVDERGRRVPDYLFAIGEAIERERVHTIRELESLGQNIDHIKTIVAMQQSHAKVGGVVERLSLQALLEDALRFHSASFERHGLEIVREFAELPEVVLDRHKVFQIVMNLLSNARQAIHGPEVAVKRIVVRTLALPDQWAAIEVADSGYGIPAENLTKIFNLGFTTKKDGHGFGLHSSACAAVELGGSLRAVSDGPGRGAVFTLRLPLC